MSDTFYTGLDSLAVSLPADAGFITNTGNGLTSDSGFITSLPLSTIISGTHSTTWSGAWSPAQSNSVVYRQFGTLVMLYFPFLNIAANVSTFLIMDTPLPVSLRPIRNFSLNMSVLNNGRRTGVAQIQPSGDMQIYATDTLGNFTAGLITGFDNGTIWYFLD